jgi:hypothetical protein
MNTKIFLLIFIIIFTYGCNAPKAKSNTESKDEKSTPMVSYEDVQNKKIEKNENNSSSKNKNQQEPHQNNKIEVKLNLNKITDFNLKEEKLNIIKSYFSKKYNSFDVSEENFAVFKLKNGVFIANFVAIKTEGSYQMKFKYMGIIAKNQLSSHLLIGFFGAEKVLSFESIRITENNLIAFNTYKQSSSNDLVEVFDKRTESVEYYKLTENNILQKQKKAK